MWNNVNVKSDVRGKYLKTAFTRSPIAFPLFFNWLQGEGEVGVVHLGIHLFR